MGTAIALLSGGLDSATATAQAIVDGHRVVALTFRYGQRHVRELEAASTVANALGVDEHLVVDLDMSLWGGSSLTDSRLAVPTDGPQDDSIPSTYVPGRNTVFIAVGLSVAEARMARAIYLGISAIDYSGYPDCRPEYIEQFQRLAAVSSKAGLEGRAPELVAPLLHETKADTVRRALALGVPIERTWSCYLGGAAPCGTCDSCRIRDAALIQAGRSDLATPRARHARL